MHLILEADFKGHVIFIQHYKLCRLKIDHIISAFANRENSLNLIQDTQDVGSQLPVQY